VGHGDHHVLAERIVGEPRRIRGRSHKSAGLDVIGTVGRDLINGVDENRLLGVAWVHWFHE
jgi:hypothetical protein